MLVLDEIQTRAESDGAQPVEHGIQPRQEDPLLRQCGRRMMHIQDGQSRKVTAAALDAAMAPTARRSLVSEDIGGRSP